MEKKRNKATNLIPVQKQKSAPLFEKGKFEMREKSEKPDLKLVWVFFLEDENWLRVVFGIVQVVLPARKRTKHPSATAA